MKNNKTIRTLKQINKHAFKALNYRYGFNFEKDFDIYEIKTPFTLNKIDKLISPKHTLKSYKGEDEVVVLLHYPQYERAYRNNRLYAVELIGTGAGDFNIEAPICGRYPYSCALDKFYAKYDFNEARKDEDIKAYVVAQKKSLLSGCYTKPSKDMNERHTAEDIHNAKYYSRSDFDKSGYCTMFKYNELKRKAKELRAERKKAEFLNADNTARIEEMKKKAEVAKTIIKERFEMATNSNDVREVERALSSWGGFGDILDSLQKVIDGEKNKSFSSIDTFNDYCHRIEKATTAIIAWNY